MKKIILPSIWRVLCGAVLFSILPVSGVLRGADVTYPPEPQEPDSNLPAEQWRIANDKWWAAHRAWEDSLTAQQYQAWQNDKQVADEKRNKAENLKHGIVTDLPEAGSSYDWEKDASKKKLSSALIDSLKKQKAAFGASVKQSFDPYMGGPVFITADSLLNGFHVLFEDSFRALELREAYQLASNLEALLQAARNLQADEDNRKLNFPAARYQAALRHEQLVIGPAIVLMGGSLDSLDLDVRDEVIAQVEKIRRAEAVELPSWLAPKDENSLLALDYRLCKPVGFYADNETLAAYFKAVRWLQMVPFRGSRIVEMDAAVLIGLARGSWREIFKPGDNFQRIARLVGPPDDPSPFDLMGILDRVFPRDFKLYDCTSPEVQVEIVKKLIGGNYYEINSDLRAKAALGDSFANVVVRMMPAARLQDAVLFQRLMDNQIAPSGLAVAAMLESPFASGKLPAEERKIVEAVSRETAPKDDPYTDRGGGLQIYERYVHALKSLFLPPAPEAPDFLRNEFWKAKSCQTALAGWAQMRHTFTLQAKKNATVFGIVIAPPGFVEPNPDFFARMTQMLESARRVLESEQCFDPNWTALAEDARAKIKLMREARARFDISDTFKSYRNKLQGEEGRAFDRMCEVLADYMPYEIRKDLQSDDPHVFQKAFEQWIAAVVPWVEAIEHRELLAVGDEQALRSRWDALISLSAKLEAMSHKQLRKQPWTDDEAIFLRQYGEKLGFVMGYLGNSWEVPRDDAPRWVEVSRDPQRDTAFAVAVGRPRYLYVLYPWNGMEILCQGSVMQYYEYDAKGALLTDAEWLKLLDSSDAPSIPDWLRPYADAPTFPASKIPAEKR